MHSGAKLSVCVIETPPPRLTRPPLDTPLPNNLQAAAEIRPKHLELVEMIEVIIVIVIINSLNRKVFPHIFYGFQIIVNLISSVLERFHQSRTKVGGLKTIRYCRSSDHKR